METDEEFRGKAYVHFKSWKEAYTGLVDQNYLDALTLEKCIQIAYRWPDNILVAKDGGRVVGFVGYGESRDKELPDAGEVFAIYILGEYYGTGLGRRLMDAAIGRLGNRRIAVWVLKGNERAIRFYEKYGFRFTGCEKAVTIGAQATELRMVFTPHGL